MKNSGIEWIGKIPEDWEISKTKYLTKLYTGNSIKDEEKKLYEDKADAGGAAFHRLFQSGHQVRQPGRQVQGL